MMKKLLLILSLLYYLLAFAQEGCDAFALKADMDNHPEFSVLIQEKPELIPAWKSCIKHSNLRTNPSFLGTIDNLVKNSNKGIDLAKIEDALNGSFGDVISNASENDLVKVMDRMQMPHFNAQHLDEIIERLDNPEYLIKQDLIDNPSSFKDFDEILEDPGRFWEKYSEGDFIPGSNLEKWAQWKWFKDLRQSANAFEDGAAYVKFKQITGLADDEIVTQVTLLVDGKKIRIDYLGAKNGKFYLGDAKFSTKDKDWISDWLNASTENQRMVFQAFESGNVNSIIVKATDPEKLALLQQRLGLENNSPILFNQTKLSQIGSTANQQSVKTVVNLK